MKVPYRLILLALLLLAAGVRLQQTAVLATQADEGVHVTVAEQVAAGEVVYRDLFENRTPGVEWLLAALFRLAGAGVFPARLVTVLAALLTVAALYLAAHEMGGAEPNFSARLAGTVAAFLFALAPLPAFWARFAMLEHFATAAATLSIAVALRALRRPRFRFWLAAGFLAGLAVLAKQTALVTLGVTLFFFLLQSVRQPHKSEATDGVKLWPAAGAYLLGFASVIAVFLLLLLLQGALGDFLRFFSGAERVTLLSGLNPRLALLARWAARRPLIPLSLLGGTVALYYARPAALLPLLWAAAESGVLLLAPELDLDWGGFSHYVVPAAAALSLLGGYGAAWLARVARWDLQRVLVTTAGLLLVAATLPGWLADLEVAVTKADYPSVTTAAEKGIGQAVASVTAPSEPILVLGNAIFYHHARRTPAARFFHFPQYLSDSALAAEAIDSVAAALVNPGTGAVLVSRMHLDERLPQRLLASLWAHWVPVARFPYPYQRDAFLFLPRTAVSNHSPEATFTGGLALSAVDIRQPGGGTLLVGLYWRPHEAPATDYTVFVHLLDGAGNLVAQHDGIPVVGFRPTSSWDAGEVIEDWHWLALPAVVGDEHQLSIGLYNSASGERAPLRGPLQASGETDIVGALTIPVNIEVNEHTP